MPTAFVLLPVAMIISRDNSKVKWMRSLQDGKGRRQERAFLIEGVILVEEALRAGHTPRLVLYDSEELRQSRRGRRLLQELEGLQAEQVSTPVLQSVSDTVTVQGVVAALPLPEPKAVAADGLVVVLDGLRDPGNVGTILRTAEAAACVAVMATPDTADLFSPKVVRAGMGAHFRLPLFPECEWAQLNDLLAGRNVYLAEASGEIPYYTIDWTRPAALVVGSETEGFRPDALRCATGRVSIPMPGRAESLNAAVATSIIIFESVRQNCIRSDEAQMDVKE